MSDKNTFHIPTAAEIAAEVVAKISSLGLIVPGRSLDIDEAAWHLQCAPKTVRKLVEGGRLRAGNLSAGSGQKATLRFSPLEIERYLRAG